MWIVVRHNMVPIVTTILSLIPYWNDPRIHQLGNGKIHAMVARPATWFINRIAYNGRDIRKELLEDIGSSESVVDLCCGTGTSTRVGGDTIGVDTSEDMLREARWRRGKYGSFVLGNAETWGETNCCDVATIFFALHEMPQYARRNVLKNAQRIARRRVIVCDISPAKIPSEQMLKGEPYILEYQENIVSDILSFTNTSLMGDIIPGRVMVCFIDID